jgi:hypothetical protein
MSTKSLNLADGAFQPMQTMLQIGPDPFWQWEQIHLRVKMVLRQQIAGLRSSKTEDVRWMQLQEVTDPEFVDNVRKLATEIDELSGKETDANIFAITQLGLTGCPVTHSMRAAFVSSLVARGQGMSDAERQVLVSAALTMNIAMLDLQETLHKQEGPLNSVQRTAIETHPVRGREYLETFGVSNQDWLRAVLEHHEIAGGKGYPAKLAAVFPLAEVIQYADTYCAMTRPRGSRKALEPKRAAYKLFIAASAHKSSISASILKMLGIYPPGCFVKLSNGEIAVVVGRGPVEKAPKVCSLRDSKGAGYTTPLLRDTTAAEFAVVDVVAADEVKLPMSPSKLFGYEK